MPSLAERRLSQYLTRDRTVRRATTPGSWSAGCAHRLDEVVDRARGDALHISPLDYRRQCLLGHAAWLHRPGLFKPFATMLIKDARSPGAG